MQNIFTEVPNALFSIKSTDSGIITFVSFPQFTKDSSPMLITPSLILTDSMSVPKKALLPIPFIPLEVATFFLLPL